MLIDNSQFKAFQTCPYLWYEKFLKKIEFDWEKKGVTAAHFGTRMHQLFEEHYRDLQGSPIPPYEAFPNDGIELEAQSTMALYRNYYPVEPFSIVDVEKTFRLPLGKPRCSIHFVDLEEENRCPECEWMTVNNPIQHEYTGKFDVILRDNETGLISVMDHKNNNRQSYTNNPKAWAARSQGTLYLWAARQLYPQPEGLDWDKAHLLINVIRRQSDKGQIGPEFSRQQIQRSIEQMDLAVEGLIKIADQMEEMKATYTERDWAASANRNACMQGNFGCEFYDPHLLGWSDDLLRQYKPTVPYLDL